MSLLLVLAGFSPAAAFCGAYVGGAGAELYSEVSQVAVVRQGKTTTLTLASDYVGDSSEFALIIPVPAVLGPDDVSIVAPEVLSRVEVYSGPRLVAYTCEDFYGGWYPDQAVLGCQEYSLKAASVDAAEDGSGPPADGSVKVESAFVEGEYAITVLSAEEGQGLTDWLSSEGFAIPEATAPLFQEYIDRGSYFLAARVNLDLVGEAPVFLRPLQLRYEADALTIPIRLGTANAGGAPQDVLLYVLGTFEGGQYSITNYPEATIEDECMLEFAEGEFGAGYADAFSDAFEGKGQGQAVWVREYAWAPYHCDPCAEGDALNDDDVQALGFEGSAFDAYFTRLHVRYTPAAATADLVLNQSNFTQNEQIRFIQYDPNLEDMFPVCGVGMVTDNPGSCAEEFEAWNDEAEVEYRRENALFACASQRMSPGLPVALVVMAGMALHLRRRR